jgi:hypothetical protein
VILQFRCEGAPRDLGLDQGSACRDAIRRATRSLGPIPGGVELGRDLTRHFPHLAERTAGLASGAGVSTASLLALLARTLGEAYPFEDAGLAMPAGGGLAVRLRASLDPADLVLRWARPDGGYPSLTISHPALAASLAGVNERGLAAAAIAVSAPASGEACRAPGMLLLEGCLERLDTVEKALEWCERRPGGGRARLLFADAAGARGAIELDGEKRSRVEPHGASSPSRAPGVWIDAARRSLSIELSGARSEELVLAPPALG